MVIYREKFCSNREDDATWNSRSAVSHPEAVSGTSIC